MRRILLGALMACMCASTASADHWKDRLASGDLAPLGRILKIGIVRNNLIEQGVLPSQPLTIKYSESACGSEADACFNLNYEKIPWPLYHVIFMGNTDSKKLSSAWPSFEEQWFNRIEFVTKFQCEPPPLKTDSPGFQGSYQWGKRGGLEVDVWCVTQDDTTRCDPSVNISAALFTRGSYDLDPDGLVLWHGKYLHPPLEDPHRLYYRYAISLDEAVAFVMLHEYGHSLGILSEGAADEYALSMIVELRKAHLGLRHHFRRFGSAAFVPCSSYPKETSIIYRGGLPPANDMPPGSIRN